jgi:hypothetical protein
MRCDEEGRVVYLIESESRRGQGTGTDRGRQPDGLERGYKCLSQVAASACRHRGIHGLTN